MTSASREARYRRYLDLDTLFPFGEPTVRWIGDDRFWTVVAEEGRGVLHVHDLANGGHIGPLPLDAIARAFGATDALTPGQLPFDRVEASASGLLFCHGSERSSFDAGTQRFTRTSCASTATRPGRFLRQLVLAPPSPVPDAVSPDGRRFATVVDGDLRVVSIDDGTASVLTSEAGPDVGWDLESGRRPFARTAAVHADPWSPDGRRLVAARIDRRAVPTVPLIDFLGDDVDVGRFHVEQPGRPLARTDFFVFDVATGDRTPLELGDAADRLLLPLGWMPDGSGCWFLRYARDLRLAEVVAVDAAGRARVVLRETGESFVRVQHDLLYPGNAGFAFLPDSSGFLWLSERSGWNHVHHVDRDGRVVRALTEGAWPVLSIEGTSRDGRTVFFAAHSDAARPYDIHLHRVAIDGGPSTRLTDGPGQRRFALSPSRRHVVEVRSTPLQPPVCEARDLDGRLVRVVHEVDIEPLRTLGWRPPEEVVVKALDGVTDLWGVLYLPADFDPARRYPVVEHIYAGPQVAYVERGFSLGHAYKPWNVPQALAQLGFAVVVLDAPGTPERSKAFHDQVLHAMGRRQIDEHAAALRRIGATRPWLDLDRVGIFGHSWGGYYALRALADAPDLYKAAVASGSAFAPDNVMSEPYLGSDRGGAGYAGYDALSLAPRIGAPLMIVTGTAEVSMFHAAMRMTHALIAAGVRHELIVLPGQPHGYSGAAADYFIDATTRFFQRHLGDDRGLPPEGGR